MLEREQKVLAVTEIDLPPSGKAIIESTGLRVFNAPQIMKLPA